MDSDFNIIDLISRGGMLSGISGSTYEEIYRGISLNMNIPSYVDRNELYDALCQREKLMSTAIGHGIALPHTKFPLVKAEEEQQISIIYPENPVDYHAPDNEKIKVMFIILGTNQQNHLKILSQLAFMLENKKIMSLIKSKPSLEELTRKLKELI